MNLLGSSTLPDLVFIKIKKYQNVAPEFQTSRAHILPVASQIRARHLNNQQSTCTFFPLFQHVIVIRMLRNCTKQVWRRISNWACIKLDFLCCVLRTKEPDHSVGVIASQMKNPSILPIICEKHVQNFIIGFSYVDCRHLKMWTTFPPYRTD